MLAAITSASSEGSAVTIDQDDCVDGALAKRSVVKPAPLFTIHSSLVLKKICALRREKLDAVLAELTPTGIDLSSHNPDPADGRSSGELQSF